MKRLLLLCTVMSLAVCLAHAQQKTYWTRTSEPAAEKVIGAKTSNTNYKLFSLDLSTLKVNVNQAPSREARTSSTTVISFPTPEGQLKSFRVVEASVLHPELAAKYPGIRSFAGQGIDDATATIRFSISEQRGFHGMVLSGRNTYYIDPYTNDQKVYKVYGREDASRSSDFECYTGGGTRIETQPASAVGKTNDKKLRKYRLAMSCTAEYGNIFAGSTGTDAQKKANILAQMNVTMTRVNGVYERDLSITMQIVANNDLIIYYGSASTDPWSNEWNTKTQQVIDAAIGSANYDIGHNFNTTGGGNAGCIGCVCTNGSKGSGYTGRSDPTGDAFDIDYVAHEMGHQFGGYHVQSNSSCRSGSGTTEVEPGSGSSIMGYAGICAADVQANSDAYFAYVNIRDISANVQTGASSGCAQVTNIVNNPPTANAGADYVIPKSTAFVLRGSGTDPDGDALTYTWEQNDPGNPNSNAAPASTRTVGPMFRSREGNASPDRYLPRISDVVANNLTPTWEVIPSVARTLNFSLVTRDNKAGGGQTGDDLMVVTVNGTAGPFVVSAPNTAVSWASGSTQTVTWSVASTNVAPVNCANVNILLSTDGGFTYPVTVLANTPNDGTQAVTIPNNVGTTNRIKIEAVGNIFYDISNVNFTITGAPSCTATVPTGLAASGVTSTGATLNWTAVSGATYDVQYRVVGAGSWTTVAAASNSTVLSGLANSTQYEAQVRSNCTSTSSAYSASVNFTTAAGCVSTVPTGLAASGITSSGATLNWNAVTDATYDVQYRVVGAGSWTIVAASSNTTTLSGLTASTQYEAQVRSKCTSTTSAYSASVNFTTSQIQLVYCASKGNSVADEYIGRVQLGTINNVTGANAGYGNFTAISTNLTKSTAYTITVTPTWTGSTYAEGYSVWIDYNIDGDFADAGEQVWTKAAASTTPASGSFTVPATATTGSTRMRVSMKYNAIPTSCETFSYGEVEDYTVNIQGAAPDTQAPSTPTNFAASGITNTSANLSWTASTDNVAVTGYEIRVNGTLNGSPAGTTHSLTGLTASTTYSVSVTAKDAAGNSSVAATINVTTTSTPPPAYCASKGNSVADEYIGRVQLGTINNVTGANAGYGNFTALSTNLGRSTAYTITVTPTWTGSVYSEGYAAWIDYNQDGDFADSGEQVWSRATSTTTPVSGTFTIPATASLGATRIRVSMKYNGTPTSCETFSYGEVEDYTVNIQSTARIETEAISLEDETDVYPNPVETDRLYVKVASGVVIKSVQIISPNGTALRSTNGYSDDGIDVAGIHTGIYILRVNTDKGSVAKKFLKK